MQTRICDFCGVSLDDKFRIVRIREFTCANPKTRKKQKVDFCQKCYEKMWDFVHEGVKEK